MAFLLGAGMTAFGRLGRPLLELLADAGRDALADAGLARVDRILVASQAPEALAGEANLATKVAGALGLVPVPAVRVESAPSSGASAVEAACHAVDAGAARAVLVVAGETMTTLPTAETAAHLARMMDPLERRYGLTMPAVAALQAQLAMAAYGWTREELADVPVKAHRHGALSERAQFRRPVTREDVLASPEVAAPLRLLDCAPMTDGAAAVVVADRGPVRVAGVGHATDLPAWTDRRYEGWTHRFGATAWAAHAAFERARRTRGDVDVVETHDAFSHLEPANLVDLGFFEAAEALRATRAGETSLGGRLPVNVGGGLKARGHPVGATGAAQIVELYEQLTGRAGARQVDGARLGLAHNIGGFGNNVVVTLLEAA